MGGFFGVASTEDCVFDLYFGTDYHSHLGTRRAGLAVYDEECGFDKAIHNIENAPFRTKFTSDFNAMKGNITLAESEIAELTPAIDLLFKEGNPTGVKAMTAAMGITRSEVRLPLVEGTEELAADIKSAIARYELK